MATKLVYDLMKGKSVVRQHQANTVFPMIADTDDYDRQFSRNKLRMPEKDLLGLATELIREYKFSLDTDIEPSINLREGVGYTFMIYYKGKEYMIRHGEAARGNDLFIFRYAKRGVSDGMNRISSDKFRDSKSMAKEVVRILKDDDFKDESE